MCDDNGRQTTHDAIDVGARRLLPRFSHLGRQDANPIWNRTVPLVAARSRCGRLIGPVQGTHNQRSRISRGVWLIAVLAMLPFGSSCSQQPTARNATEAPKRVAKHTRGVPRGAHKARRIRQQQQQRAASRALLKFVQEDAEVGSTWFGAELSKKRLPSGVVVGSVTSGSPAAAAGLLPGDLLVQLDGLPLQSHEHLARHIAELEPQQTLSLGMIRGDRWRLKRVTLAPRAKSTRELTEQYQGKTLPAVLTGELNRYLGRVVVLQFMSRDCAGCERLNTALSLLDDRYPNQLQPVGVTDDAWLSQSAERFPVVHDADSSWQQALGAFAKPTAFILDERGRVQAVLSGADPGQVRHAEALIERLIGEQPSEAVATLR